MSIKSLLSANLQMKLLSLLLAVTLWIFVVFETDDKLEIPLSVSYVNIPAGLVVMGDSGSGISLRIEGPRILLLRQKLKGVAVSLDLSGAGEGRVVYSGVERLVRLIQGVKVLGVLPPKTELILVAAPVTR